MDSLRIKLGVLFNNAIERGGVGLHEKKYKSPQTDGTKEFEIIPGESIIVQMARFRARYKQLAWNKELQIKNYLGTFKIEYWIYAEQQLRDIDGLSKISFINTKLNKKHLKILFQLLLWVRPDQLQIKFKANELDDDDLDEFTMELLDKEIKFDQLIVISNPGIFKGHFLSRLQSKLEQMKPNYTTFQYQLEINYDFCSMALFKTSLEIMDEDQEMIEDIKRVIQETLYYDLNLSKCFTNDNYQGFQYLIEQCYHEDNLEQLQSLNLRENYLGSSSEFLIQCENISLAKGLLSLGLGKQPNMEFGFVMQALTGDRYDRLRLNKIDLSENNKMLEKTWKIFVDGIMTSCKEVNITATLPQELATLNKFLVWIEQGQREIKKLKEISKQQNIIAKLPLKALDLSKLENYNRHDLIEMFLSVYVFNEHSSLKTFVIQNCDDGRKKTYIKTKKQFVEYINSKQSDRLYQEFKPTLQEIHIANQTYKQTQEILIELMNEVVFTNQKDLFTIHSVKFLDGSFKVAGFDDGMKAFFTQLAQKGKDEPKGVKLNIKKLELKNTTIYDHECLVDAFLANPLVQLEEFCIIQDQLHSEIFKKMYTYANTLNEQFYSLKILSLYDIQDVSYSLPEILKTCVYHPKIRLINLKLGKFTIKEDQNQLQQFQEIYNKLDIQFESSIEVFSFGEFDGSHHLWDFINYTIMDVHFKPKKIEILEQSFSNHYNQYRQKQLEIINLKQDQLQNLEEIKIRKWKVSDITLDGVLYKKADQWEWIAKTFIFKQGIKCELIEIDGIELDEPLQVGFVAAIDQGQQELAIKNNLHETDEQQQQIKTEERYDQILLNSKITTLSIKNCAFKHEFLSVFFRSIFCKIQDLTIENCTGFDESLKLSREYDEIHNKERIYSFALRKINLKGTPMNDVDMFKWFFQNVVFNTKRQILEYINLQSCKINDEKLQILGECIEIILKNSQQGYKRYYKVRELNLEDNKEITTGAWKKFIDIILTTSHMEKNDERRNEQKENAERKDEDSKQENDYLLHKGSDEIHIDMSVQGVEKYDQNSRFKFFENYLNIHEKMLMQKDLFKLYSPFKLQEVSLSMSFNDDCRADCYYKSIKGLILFPGTNVNRLILKALDLNEFMVQYNRAHKELEQLLYRPFQLKLEYFEITSLTHQSEESTKQLVENIIKSSISTLSFLSLAGFTDKNIISELVKYDQTNQIETLLFKDITETLDQQSSKDFIEKLILGKYFNVKKLYICKGIKIQKLDDPHFVLDTNYQYPLKDLEVNFENQEAEAAWLRQCATIIMGGQFIKLKTLTITSKDDPQIFQEVVDLSRFTIDELSLAYTVIWSQIYQDFFYHARRKLETLKLTSLKITSDLQVDENLDFVPQQPNLKLHLKIIESDSFKQKFLDTIVFGKFFKVDWMKFIDHVTISSLEKVTSVNFQNLKYLLLNPGLLYNSTQQLSENALYLIGSRLIYNEDSQLETIGFASCHLKPAGVKALVRNAEPFRKQITEQGRESACYLKLKTFDVYYSLYLLEEGFELLIRDIIFFEYITLTRLLNEVTNFNNEEADMLCEYGQKWIKFQNEKNRKHKIYQFTYFSIGRNEFIKLEPVWKKLVQNFLFSDLCPYLETLCMHFMAIDDQIGAYITKYVLEFLNNKPSKYVHNVKKFQFSLNKDFTPAGWENISRNLLFHKKNDFVELHLSSCMLDSLEKLRAVCNPAIEKALARPNKKLALHSLNTFNLTNKDFLVNYLSPRPADYKFDDTWYVEPQNAYQYGILDGFQEQFGTIVRVIQKIVHTVDKLKKDNEWKNQSRHRWVTFHLSFTESYIKVINDECKKQFEARSFDLYFSYASLDQLAKIFIYDRQTNGEPYPANLLFQEEFYRYIRQSDCILKRIYILPEFRGENDKLTQFHIYEYWKRIKGRNTSIDQVIIDYTANDDLFDKMIEDGYTERDILQLLRIFPPQKIRTQDSMTISFIKGVFTILWDVDHFNYSTVTFDQDNILNIGIGYFLRERIFRKDILRQAKYTLYLFLSLFVSEQELFEFDDKTKDLNLYLSHQRLLFFILSFFIFVLYFFAIFLGYWLTYKYQYDASNKSGNSLNANYSCYCYLFVTAIFELWFYRKLLAILPKFDKGMVQVDEIAKIELQEEEKFQQQFKFSNNKVVPDQQIQNFEKQASRKNYKKKRTVVDQTKRSSTFFIAQQKSKKIFTRIQEVLQEITSTNFGKLMTIIIKIVMSQLEKLDLFNDIGFIFQCDQNNSTLIFYLSIAITLFNMLNDFISFLIGVYFRIREHATSNKLISTKFVNDFYSLTFIGKFAALSEIFDIVAPYNVTVIPNNRLFRYLMPKFAGRSINNNMKNYLFKFLFKFVPQLVLQLLFVIQQALSTTGSLTWSILLTIVVTGVNIFFAFIRFMSIRPPTISNTDFDSLAEKKIKKYDKIQQERYFKEHEQLEFYNNLYKLNEKQVEFEIEQKRLSLSPKNEQNQLI